MAKKAHPLARLGHLLVSFLAHLLVLGTFGYFWLDADRQASLGALTITMMAFSGLAYMRTLHFGLSRWRLFLAGEALALLLLSAIFISLEGTGAPESTLVYSVESSVDSARSGFDRLVYLASLLGLPLYVSMAMFVASVVGHRYALAPQTRPPSEETD